MTESIVATESSVSTEETLDNREAQQALKKIHKDLADYHAAGQVTELDLEITEQDVEKRLLRDASRSFAEGVRADNRFMSFSPVESWGVLMSYTFGLPVALADGLAEIGWIPESLLSVALATMGLMVFTIASVFLPKVSPYVLLRKKLILNKRFKREICAITSRNIHNAERNRKLLAGRGKKLEKIEQRIKMLATQYEKNNPGMTLRLSPAKDGVIEAVKPTTMPAPAQSQKELLNRIAPKTVEA